MKLAAEKAENEADSVQISRLTKLIAVSACAPVAQRLEQQTHNLLVRGSNPCGGTKKAGGSRQNAGQLLRGRD